MDEEPKPVKDSTDAEQKDYEIAGRSTADYANYEPSKKQRSPIWRKLIIGLIVLILLAGVGGGAYWYLKNHGSTKKPAQNTDTALTEGSSVPAASKISATTKNYTSANFNLSFDHPEDWTVADEGGGQLTVSSPAMQLKDEAGKTVAGQIVMTIRAKSQKLPEFDSGNASAVRQSVQISYAKPTQSQRGSTFESFLRYAKTVNTAVLDGIYITGDSGYTVNQAIPKVDIEKVDPTVSITFIKCADSACAGTGTPLSIAVSTWDDTSFSQPIELMLKSLAIT